MRPTEAVVKTPQKVAGLAVTNYHRAMLERAVDALEDVDAVERHYLAATVIVPAGLVQHLKQELDAFHQKLLDLCSSYEDDAEQVLQMHMVVVPLSDSAERDDG